MTVVERARLTSSDEVELEAEYGKPVGDPAGVVVLCHPHPQYGGTMRSIVVSALFDALPDAGYACLRFNFRGVERSGGTYTGGDAEVHDVRAAVAAASDRYRRGPLVVAGWSFGADMTLSVTDPQIAGWVGIAPPLRFRTAFAAAADARPKHLVLAQHDDFRPAADVQAEVASWASTTTEVVPGASHFFVGRTDRVVAATLRFLQDQG